MVMGFAAGYYLGAKAGRERYEQMRRILREVPLERMVAKGRAAADLARERFRPDTAEPEPVLAPPPVPEPLP